MQKIIGTETAINIFKKEVEKSSISDVAKLFKIPLQKAYAIQSGHNVWDALTVRRVLAYEANRLKAERFQKAVDKVEANSYKGKRDTSKQIERRNTKYHRETMPELWF